MLPAGQRPTRKEGDGVATPKKAQQPETPGYVKTEEVAKLVDLTPQRVRDLTRAGVLKKYKTPAGDRYMLFEANVAYIRYLRELTNAKQKSPEAADVEQRRAKAEADFKEDKAAIMRLQRQELELQMHRSEDVEAVLTDLVYEIRSMLTALPGRLAMDTARIKTPEEESVRIRDEVNEILDALSNYRYDKDQFRRRMKERKGEAQLDDDE